MALEVALEGGAHHRRCITRHVAAVAGDLAHQRRRDEAVIRASRQEDGVEFRLQVSVGVRNLQLVLEVRPHTQAAYDDARANSLAVIDEQALKRIDHHVRKRGADLAQHFEPLLGGKQRRAARVLADGDDQAREQPRRALHQIEVTVRRRIEAAGVQRELHAVAHGVAPVLPGAGTAFGAAGAGAALGAGAGLVALGPGLPLPGGGSSASGSGSKFSSIEDGELVISGG